MAEPSASAAGRLARLVVALQARAGRPWFLPSVGVFPVLDYALPVLPNQILLIALSVLQPRLWWRFAAVFVAGAALGALLAALAVQQAVQPLVGMLLGEGSTLDPAPWLRSFIEHYGLIGLAGLSLLPSPPRTAVVVCAAAGLPPAAIMLAVGAGRLLPLMGLALVGAKSPGLLRRFRSVDALLREVESGVAEAGTRKNDDR